LRLMTVLRERPSPCRLDEEKGAEEKTHRLLTSVIPVLRLTTVLRGFAESAETPLLAGLKMKCMTLFTVAVPA